MGDDGDPGRVAGLHIVSRIDQAKPDTAGNGGDNAAVNDIQLLLIDLRLIELHQALVLLHDVDLIFVLLAGDRILFGQFLVARKVDLRLREHALIARELALVLGLQKLVGPGVDLRQKIALLDHLSFGEPNLLELTVDLGLHGDGGDRRDGAERVDRDANIALSDGCSADRLRRGLLNAPAARRLRRMYRAEYQIGATNNGDQNDQANDNARSSTPAFDDWRGRRSAKVRADVVIRSARSLVHMCVRLSTPWQYITGAGAPHLMKIR